MAKILIFGVSGFLGSSLAMYLRKRHVVLGTYFSHPIEIENVCTFKLDLFSRSLIGEKIKSLKPDIIIYAAGMSGVEECERKPQFAEVLNSEVLSSILPISEKIGVRLFYCSSDLLYEGRFGNYGEEESISADNAYTVSKISAEHYIKFHSSIYIVLRLALMYGPGSGFRHSFTDWLKGKLSRGESVNLYTDQYRSPIYVRDVARAIEAMIPVKSFGKVFNLGGREKINRYNFGLKFAEKFGYSEELIKPVRFVDEKSAARRGLDCSLNCDAFYKTFNFTPRTLDESFDEMYREYMTGVTPDPPLERSFW